MQEVAFFVFLYLRAHGKSFRLNRFGHWPLPQIIPIKDLKKTSELSEMCRQSKEPVFITKNGYGDMVIMSMET
jgi:hypothetical protein